MPGSTADLTPPSGRYGVLYSWGMKSFVFLWILALGPATSATAQAPREWTAGLEREVKTLGKLAWRPMLQYDIMLHRVDTHPATLPFEFPWEDTGRGYG